MVISGAQFGNLKTLTDAVNKGYNTRSLKGLIILIIIIYWKVDNVIHKDIPFLTNWSTVKCIIPIRINMLTISLYG